MFLRMGDIGVGEDSPVLVLARVVTDSAAWTIGDRRMIANRFGPFMRGVRGHRHVFGVLRWFFRLIGKDLAFLVVGVHETAT